MGDDVIGDHHIPPVVVVVLLILVVGDGGLGCSMPTTMMPPLPPMTTIITVMVMSLPGARDAAAADYADGDHCGDHHRYHCQVLMAVLLLMMTGMMAVTRCRYRDGSGVTALLRR